MATAEVLPERKVYRVHREKQLCRILESAERLFDERGIDRVTMAEIVSAAGLRPSTLYQYFSSKDDIVWALVRQTMERSALRIQSTVEKAHGLALDRISALMEGLTEQLVKWPEEVRFMAQFDALYARDWSAERLLSPEAELFPDGFTHLTTLIHEGIADGSLRADLDPQISMHAALNAAVATQRRLASLGSRVEAEYGQPVERLFREATRVILQGLSAQ